MLLIILLIFIFAGIIDLVLDKIYTRRWFINHHKDGLSFTNGLISSLNLDETSPIHDLRKHHIKELEKLNVHIHTEKEAGKEPIKSMDPDDRQRSGRSRLVKIRNRIWTRLSNTNCPKSSK